MQHRLTNPDLSTSVTALPGGVLLTAPPDSPGPHLPARPDPIRAPAPGQAVASPKRPQPQRDGAITGPSAPLGQSELIIGTERILGDRSGPTPLVTTAAVHTGQQQGRLRFWDPVGCAVCRIARRGCPTVDTHGQVAVGKERSRQGV